MTMDLDNDLCLPKDYLELANDVLPFTNQESLGTFYSEWTIDQWSKLPDSSINGPKFKTNDNSEWSVLLYPRGNGQHQHISLYLANKSCKEAGVGVCAQFILCIVDPLNTFRFYHKESQHRFDEYASDWGFTQYIDMQEIQDYIVNDTVKLVTIVKLIKDPTGVLWHHFYNYDSKKMTGHVGLLNQGATCYMNSLFQSLFFTNIYRKAVFQIPTNNDEPTTSTALALQRLFYYLQFSNRAVSTAELTQSFGWNLADVFMQHDVQEFNRLLQDKIDRSIKEAIPAQEVIKNLFKGSMKSYIRCINVNTESSKSETFSDIQLNVRGCKDLDASFKHYIQEEVLEGDNKYLSEEYGLQDAKKGVIFEKFPPVLHLQLKRFDYDLTSGNLVKINDRYEFPSQIDLSPYLDSSATMSDGSPSSYILHGVLVHTGDFMGGHYFAFVRPTKEDQWFKFDDDRVTPATLTEVLEDNYGGIPLHPPSPGMKNVNRTTSAYMLVYIRESMQEEVLSQVTQNDIPQHLVTRIQEEERTREEIERQEAEKHLYMRAYITDDSSFLMNNGTDFVAQSQVVDPPPNVQVRQVLRNQSLKEFLRLYSLENNGTCYYLWYLENRVNGTVRPGARFKKEDLELSMEEACKKISKYPILRFYMEPVPPSHLITADTLLVFVKLFDLVTQSLRGVGKIYVTKDSLVSSALKDINVMVGFELGTELDVYEEVHTSCVELLDKNTTFREHEIQDGDILCVQKKQKIIDCQNGLLCSNVQEYYEYLFQRVEVMFYGEENDPFRLTLRKDMLYEHVVQYVGEYIGKDAAYLQLSGYHPSRGELQTIQPLEGIRLGDILQLVAKEEQNNMWCLCYNVLPVKWTELKKKKLMKLYICHSTLKDVSIETVAMPRSCTLSDLMGMIEPRDQPKRFFTVENHVLKEEFMPNQVLEFIQLQEPLYVETLPEEELNKGADDFYIQVFHYQKELSRTHSIPFKLLVIKDEPFVKTKERIRKRIGLDEKEFERISFNIISKFITIVKEDNYKLSEYPFKPQDALGLNYVAIESNNSSSSIERTKLYL